MLSVIKQTVSSVLDRPSTDAEGDKGAQQERTTGELLHECQCCGTVYLNEEPHECSTCAEMTEAIAEDDPNTTAE